jgi:hypothetical protein
MTATELSYRPPAAVIRLFQLLVLVGALALAAGLYATPQHTWATLLLVSYYLAGLGLAGLLVVALHYVTGARWSDPLLRVPEAMATILPVAAIGLTAVLVFRPALYPWSMSDSPSESPLRRIWLNRPFFLIRSLLYLAIWLAFATAVVRNARRRDRDRTSVPAERNLRISAAYLVAFGITCWLASYDWIMSLEPEWASTIFGVYNFAGLFLSGLAAFILLACYLRRHSDLHQVLDESRLHDLGTLLFSFSCFWMYTWFCQYMLIWYVDNPEETAYLRLRWQGAWPVFMWLDMALNWGVPFFVLLFRSAKRSPSILGTVAVAVIVGRWIDLSLMIYPSQTDGRAVPGIIEAGLLLGTAGVFSLAFFHSLSRAALVPPQDPTV